MAVKCILFVFLSVWFGRNTAEIRASSIFDFSVEDMRGDKISLEKFRGKVMLIVNVASECGYTDQHYKQLVQIQQLLMQTRKFVVLAFPANDFGQQEPGANSQIEQFTQMNYQVNFEIFSKIHVIGEHAHPLWKYLNQHTQNPPNWNFWKYLVDHTGSIVGYWGPDVSPIDLAEEIKGAVEGAMRFEERKRHEENRFVEL